MHIGERKICSSFLKKFARPDHEAQVLISEIDGRKEQLNARKKQLVISVGPGLQVAAYLGELIAYLVAAGEQNCADTAWRWVKEALRVRALPAGEVELCRQLALLTYRRGLKEY